MEGMVIVMLVVTVTSLWHGQHLEVARIARCFLFSKYSLLVDFHLVFLCFLFQFFCWLIFMFSLFLFLIFSAGWFLCFLSTICKSVERRLGFLITAVFHVIFVQYFHNSHIRTALQLSLVLDAGASIAVCWLVSDTFRFSLCQCSKTSNFTYRMLHVFWKVWQRAFLPRGFETFDQSEMDFLAALTLRFHFWI